MITTRVCLSTKTLVIVQCINTNICKLGPPIYKAKDGSWLPFLINSLEGLELECSTRKDFYILSPCYNNPVAFLEVETANQFWQLQRFYIFFYLGSFVSFLESSCPLSMMHVINHSAFSSIYHFPVIIIMNGGSFSPSFQREPQPQVCVPCYNEQW